MLYYFQDENFAESLENKARNSSTCHTASLATPENNEEIQQTQVNLHSWLSPKQMKQYKGLLWCRLFQVYWSGYSI